MSTDKPTPESDAFFREYPVLDFPKKSIEKIRTLEIQRDEYARQLAEVTRERDALQKLYEIITTEIIEGFGLKCMPCQSVRFAYEKYAQLRADLATLWKTREISS